MSKKDSKLSSNTSSNIWHAMSATDVLEKLKSDPNLGLSDQSAKEKLEKDGPNQLIEKKPDTWRKLVLRQFTSPLVYILLIVTLITFVLGEMVDGSIIAFVLILNAIIGAYQEGKAQSAILALRSYDKDTAMVKRNGQTKLIPTKDLVVGDIIVILEGSRIPADARIIECQDLSVDEAILTGESKTKPKVSETLSNYDLVISDQDNMVFKGTYASRGKALAVVVATGQTTEIGRISTQASLYDTEIPLQKKIKKLTNQLVLVIGFILVCLILIALNQGYELKEIFLTSASLLVAVMPEGLPIVVTLVLAQGVQRMAKNNVLIKRLQAVEALGNADVIAVDKTGTLTRNQLTVTRVILKNLIAEVEGSGYDPAGKVKFVEHKNNRDTAEKELQEFAMLSSLSANAEVFRPENEEVTVSGDPTEAAMLVFGQRLGLNKKKLLEKYELLSEIVFSYQRKYYANLHTYKEDNLIIVTGAPEVLLNKSATYSQTAITETLKHNITEEVKKESLLGHRVIALAIKKTKQTSITDGDIFDLDFIGIFIMEDQIRPEVPKAVALAQAENIKVVMITGDYPSTAKTIAQSAGIFSDGDRVLSGSEIEQMNDLELRSCIGLATVFARVTPEHKLRIIQALRSLGKTVAMTGDGVNDVPSLVSADLGVAMGKVGTKAAQASADIVLLDDDFSNIPKAVAEGKRIFHNIKKVIAYLLSTNSGEVLVIVYNVVIGATIPLNPAQIIWTNLLTDSFLVFPLTTEKTVHLSSERKKQKSLVGVAEMLRILTVATGMLLSYLLIRPFYVNGNFMLYSSVTMSIVVMSQIWIALSLRNRKSLPELFTNKWFWIAVLAVIALQIASIYWKPLQSLLRTQPLSLSDWSRVFLAGLVVPAFDIIYRLIHRQIKRHQKYSQ